MTKKNIQCSLAGLGRMTALRAQGRRGFDGVASSGRTTLLRARGLGDEACIVDGGE
jgi:hypothetical protein